MHPTTRLAIFVLALESAASGVGCGGKTDASSALSNAGAWGSGAGSTGLGGAGAGVGGVAGASGASGVSTIVGSCVNDDDCTVVLDFRAGFECWWPVAASLADVSRDACLVPWQVNFICYENRPTPPTGCPSGLIPVEHSCLATTCYFPVCTGGTCSLETPSDFGQCNTVGAAYPNC